MLYNPFSSYPQKIDELLFFQDIAISQTGIMAHYETLIQKQKYEEANTYINQQTDLHGYFAGLFNLLENRM